MSAVVDVMQGYQAYQQGKDQKKAYDKNAEILRQNAAKKRLETSLNEDIIRSQNRQKASKARAAFAELGMATSATTTGALAQMTAEQEENALLTRYQGETEAVNYMNQASMQNYYGRVAKANGKNAFRMGLIKAGVKLAMAAVTAGAGGGGGGGIIEESGGTAGGGFSTF